MLEPSREFQVNYWWLTGTAVPDYTKYLVKNKSEEWYSSASPLNELQKLILKSREKNLKDCWLYLHFKVESGFLTA